MSHRHPLVRQYQRCLNDESGRKGRCYGRADKRCVRPVFLGRCWLHDRIYRRTVMGYACSERRLFEVDGVYEGRVICRKGRRRISHDYTLLTRAPVAVDTETELRAAWGNPRVTAIDVTADIFLRACERGDPMRESPRPGAPGRTRPHAAADVLREAAAASGRDRVRRAPERDADSRRQRRAGRRRRDARRDRGHRLHDQAEPGRGAGRRGHVAASRHDRPLGPHRQPGQRRRRRRVRAARRHPGLRLDPQRQPRRRLRRRARLDRRHPRRAQPPRRQHDRRRRRRASTPTRTATSR